MALEQITFNIGAFNDANAGGNNYYTDTVFQVKKQSDNTFAAIYSDADGQYPIPQNGIDNVSNSTGECNFWVDSGNYYVEVDGKRKNFSSNLLYENIIKFNTLSDALESELIDDGSFIYIKEIESGRGLAVYADVVSGETENEMTIFNHLTKSIQIKFRARENKPQVAFMFDDAHVAHYTDVLPLFESYGFPLAFAICPRFTGEELNDTRMNTTQMLDAQKRGVEIINHSMTHANLANVGSLERAIAEIETARQWLENRGLNTVGYLAASSALNQEHLAAAKSRCAYALTIYANNDVETASIGAHSRPYSLSRLTMDGVASSATITRIKEAVKMGYSVMAYDHDAPAGSSSYLELNNVLSFANDNLDIFDVTLPRVLVSSRVGALQDIPHYKKEEQIFNSIQGYQRSTNLGFGTQTNGVNKEITITPTATGTGTVTRDIEVLPNKSYTFSCNIRSGSAQMQISMGVICLDAANATIAGYTTETSKIDYDGNNQQRYGVEFHTPTNCAKARIFWRITPLVIDGTTLLIREPSIYTGRRVLFELIEEEEDTGFTFTEITVSPDFTPDLDDGNSFFLRLDSSPCSINNPINGAPVEGLEKITFFIRANGADRVLSWGSKYRVETAFDFTDNTLGQLMVINFRWYRNLWIQESSVTWLAGA